MYNISLLSDELCSHHYNYKFQNREYYYLLGKMSSGVGYEPGPPKTRNILGKYLENDAKKKFLLGTLRVKKLENQFNTCNSALDLCFIPYGNLERTNKKGTHRENRWPWEESPH